MASSDKKRSTTKRPASTNQVNSAADQDYLPLPTMKDFASGAVGGFFCTYAGQPFDTVKVRLQTGTGDFQSMGPLKTAIQTARNEGLSAWWKGAVPSLYMALVENVVLFSANGYFQKVMAPGVKDSEIPVWKQYMIGGMAGVFSSVACNPLECVKCQLQVHIGGGSKASMLYASKELFQSEGVMGFFRGQGAQWLRDIPYYMLFFGFYKQYQLWARQMGWNKDMDNVPAIHAIAGGAICGSGAWGVVFPFDSVNSNQKTSSIKRGLVATARHMYSTLGWRGFFQGYVPCVVRGAPANAALFWGVEMTKQFWDRYLE